MFTITSNTERGNLQNWSHTPLRVLHQYGKHCGYILEQLCSVHIGHHANYAYPAIVLGSCSMFKLLVPVYMKRQAGKRQRAELSAHTFVSTLIVREVPGSYFITGSFRFCICKAPRLTFILLCSFGVPLYTFLHSIVSLAVCIHKI